MPAQDPQALDAIIVGGGVVGASCALALQARGIAATIVDPAALRPASLGNAGHIAVEQVEPVASPATLRAAPGLLFSRGGPVSFPLRSIGAWLPFALRFAAAARPARFAAGKAALGAIAAEALPAWRRQAAGIGAADLLVEDGHFVVWESGRAAAEGRSRWERADTGEVLVRPASGDEIDRISTGLARSLAGGLFFSGTARIADLDALARSLAAAFAAGGGATRRASVEEISRRGREIEIGLDDGGRLRTQVLIVAAGIGSGALLRPLGHRVPLIAERGYHLQGECPSWPEDFPPVVFEERTMILTRFRNRLRAAGLFEFARASTPPDPAKWARLRSHLDSLGIAFEGPVETWMGARPTLPDYLPAIGCSSRLSGVFYAFGHQHLGLTLAAATGEAVAAFVAGDAPPFDLSPFSIDRFDRA